MTDSKNGFAGAGNRLDAATGLSATRPRALAIAIALALGAGQAGAATFTVTSAADLGPGTLREAVDFANQASGPDIIEFASGLGEIVLQSQITINETLQIVGPAGQQVIRGGGDSRLIDVPVPGAQVTLQNLFLADGRTNTGGLGYTGKSYCGSDYGDGGAVCSGDDVTLVGTTIANSGTFGDSASGGGLFALGDVTLQNSTITGNFTSDGPARGGGVFADGALVINDSIISGNSTTGQDGDGGGIWFGSGVQISNSLISSNSTAGAYAQGGGLSGYGTLLLEDSSVVGNSTAGAYAEGGGMNLVSTSEIFNSTISGNSTGASSAPGGGIYVTGANIAIFNSTITENIGAAGAGGFESRAVENLGYGVLLESTIISGNNGPGGNFRAVPGSGTIIIDVGNSLFGDAPSEITGTSSGNVFTDAPGLGVLGDNGCANRAGAASSDACVPTHLPLATSPAIDSGSNSSALLSFDQRGPGFPRTLGNATDAGSVEADLPPLPRPADLVVAKSDGNVVTAPGESLVWTIEFANLGDLPGENVALIETVPEFTQFDPELSGDWVCDNAGASGDLCRYPIGALAGGAAGSIGFAVTVAEDADAVEIFNRVEIVDLDDSVPDPDLTDNVAIKSTPLSRLGKLRVPTRVSVPEGDFLLGFGDPEAGMVSPRLGTAAVGLGDIDGDGLADAAVSAPGVDAVLLVPGRPFAGDALPLSAFPSPDFPGFLIQADDGFGGLGDRLAGVGDVNGDGLNGLVYTDRAVSISPLSGPRRAAYLQPGFSMPPQFVVDQEGRFSPQDGPELLSLGATGPFATTVAGLGDVNADGVDDFALAFLFGAAPFRFETVFVVFGGSGFNAFQPDRFAVENFGPGNGLQLTNAESAVARFGESIGGIGDFNGDGFDDFAVGAPGQGEGAVFVIFGGPSLDPSGEGFTDTGMLDGSNGFELTGGEGAAAFGIRVTGAGDFDGDGLDDLLVSERRPAGEPGRVHLVFGTASSLPPETSLDSADPLRITRIRGAAVGDEFGIASAGLGDIDGDGLDDLALGAPGLAEVPDGQTGAAAGTGRVLVLRGDSEPPAEYAAAALGPEFAYWLTAPSPSVRFGDSVAGPGDFDGDGVPDLLITAPDVSFGEFPRAGQFWIISGALRPPPPGPGVEIEAFSVTPDSLFVGDSTEIAWAATPDDAMTVCSGSGLPGTSWDGTGKAASGTQQVDTSPLAPGTYFPRLTCERDGQTAAAEVTLEVLVVPVEIQAFSVTPDSLFVGDSTEIAWAATPDDATTVCSGSGLPGTIWDGTGKAASGTLQVDTSPLAPGTYSPRLTCERDGQTASAEVTLEVLVVPVEILAFSVTPDSLFVGNTTEIAWAATPDDATTVCTGSGLPGTIWDGTGKAASGTLQVDTSPLAPGTYSPRLTCDRDGQTASAEVTLEVLEPPAELSLDGSLTELQFFGDRFVEVELSNASDETAQSISLDLATPPGYQAMAIFRLAGRCESDDAGDVNCDADAIPDWQCAAAPDGFACQLAELPVAATAAVVLQLRGEGAAQVEAAADAVNALSVTIAIPVPD